ncbi:MAG: glycosyltransferase [Candidatus Bathyarchaeia archaeon]
MIKKLYGLDSFVLYPPVRFSSLAGFRFQNRREFAVLVAKPEAASGIMFLSDIVEKLEKNVRFVVVGRADQTGLRVVQNLKKKGLRIDYLGYVSEQVKLRLFHALSHYLHLSLNEPFGITVVEAMASGCIPIAHKSGGVTEYLPEDLLYASSSEAAQKIDAGVGLQDSELKKMLRKTAEKFDEEKFRKKFAMYVKLLDLR